MRSEGSAGRDAASGTKRKGTSDVVMNAGREDANDVVRVVKRDGESVEMKAV